MYLHFHQQQEKKEDKNAGLTNMKGKESDLSGEISNNISSVASPKGNDTFILNSSGKAVSNSRVWFRQPASLNYLILILNQELNSLNWCSS